MKMVVWITVYRDTIEKHNADWNLSDILVKEDFFKQYYNKCIASKHDNEYRDYEHFFDEYTCDDTEDFYQYAKEHNAILEIEHMEN